VGFNSKGEEEVGIKKVGKLKPKTEEALKSGKIGRLSTAQGKTDRKKTPRGLKIDGEGGLKRSGGGGGWRKLATNLQKEIVERCQETRRVLGREKDTTKREGKGKQTYETLCMPCLREKSKKMVSLKQKMIKKGIKIQGN